MLMESYIAKKEVGNYLATINFNISASGSALTVTKTETDPISQYQIARLEVTLDNTITLPASVILRLEPPTGTAPTTIDGYSVLVHMIPDPDTLGSYYIYLNEIIGHNMKVGSLNSVYYNFQIYDKNGTLLSQPVSALDVINLYKTNLSAHWSPDDLENAFVSIKNLYDMKNPLLYQKSAASSRTEQVLTPDSGYAGFSKVTIAPYTLQAKSAVVSSATQTVTADAGYDGLSSVTVPAYNLQSITINPSTAAQTITPSAGWAGIASAYVAPVTATIDPNIQPGNIASGKSILGVTGTYGLSKELLEKRNGTTLFQEYGSGLKDYIKAYINLINSTGAMLTNCNFMFGFSGIDIVPLLFDTSNVTSMICMFANCPALTTVPSFNTSNVTSMVNMFADCSSLKSILMTGMKVPFDISSSTKFEETDLVTILNNLATVTTASTLTMGATNLAKLTDADKLIATNKGWTLA